MIACEINKDEFEFKFKDSPTFVTGEKCLFDGNKNILIFRWTSKGLAILGKQFNFTNVLRYLINMKEETEVFLWSLKGFDLNFLNQNPFIYGSNIGIIHLSNLRLDFYYNKKKRIHVMIS